MHWDQALLQDLLAASFAVAMAHALLHLQAKHGNQKLGWHQGFEIA